MPSVVTSGSSTLARSCPQPLSRDVSVHGSRSPSLRSSFLASRSCPYHEIHPAGAKKSNRAAFASGSPFPSQNISPCPCSFPCRATAARRTETQGQPSKINDALFAPGQRLPRSCPTAGTAALPTSAAGAAALPTSAAGASGSRAGEESVAVVGGTGFIGRALVRRLLRDGSTVRVLTRSTPKAQDIFKGEGQGGVPLAYFEPGEWEEGVKGSTAVVNLAGTPISTRWTPTVKEDIIRSRVDTTNKIVDAILAAPADERPTVLVSSSAVGFYGISETATYDESSGAGSDFLAKVCIGWEAAARRVEVAGVRLVIIRNGIVLEKDGGALAKMIPIFQLFAGGPLGSGSQWMSWIHRDDIVELFVEAIRNPSYSGVVNGTAPNPVRVSELCDQLGQVLARPSWLPVPEFALKALLGEGASVVLDGQRVLPRRAEELGFKFKHRFVKDALAAIFR